MNTWEQSSEPPGGAVTQDVASLLDGFAFPFVEALDFSDPRFTQLPLRVPFPYPTPEPSSRLSVARNAFDSAIDGLAAIKRFEDRTAATKARLIVAAMTAASAEGGSVSLTRWQSGLGRTSAVADIALALGIPERTAASLTHHSTELVGSHPATLQALEAANISWGHAAVIVDELQTLQESSSNGEAAVSLVPGLEAGLLQHAAGTTARSFASHARRLREGNYPETLATRTRQAVAKREMMLEPGRDGMSWLTLHLPATVAQGIWVHCTRAARRQQRLPEEHRTLTQLRVDIAALMLLGQTASTSTTSTSTTSAPAPAPAPGENNQPLTTVSGDSCIRHSDDLAHCDANSSTHGERAGSIGIASFHRQGDIADLLAQLNSSVIGGVVDGIEEDPIGQYLAQLKILKDGLSVTAPPLPSAQVIVTVPVFSLLGLTQQPSELTGYGPIPTEIARQLLGQSHSFLRVLVDPVSGKPLDSNPDSYRVGSKERTLLAAMAGSCSWPNCCSPAILAEVDHIKAFGQGGKSTAANLQPLCKRHHTLKHFKDDKDRHGRPRRDNEPDRSEIKLRGWRAERVANGDINWYSPSGRCHTERHQASQSPLYPKMLAKHAARAEKAHAAKAHAAKAHRAASATRQSASATRQSASATRQSASTTRQSTSATNPAASATRQSRAATARSD